jgi:hypothetical protein
MARCIYCSLPFLLQRSILAVAAFCLLMLGGCHSSAKNSVKPASPLASGTSEQDSEDATKAAQGAEDPNATYDNPLTKTVLGALNGQELYRANYRIHVELGRSKDFCQGEANIGIRFPISPDGRLEQIGMLGIINLDGTVVDCKLVPKVDIGKMLKTIVKLSEKFNLCPDPKLDATVEKGAIWLKQMACTKYSPGVPMVPSMFATPADHLRILSINSPLTVQTSKDTSSGGQTLLKMNNFEVPYTSPITGVRYDRTMDWSFKLLDLDDMPITKSLLFQELSIRISMDKVSFISIRVQINVLDETEEILGGGFIGKAAAGIGAILVGGGGMLIISIDTLEKNDEIAGASPFNAGAGP